ncbi:MAG: hypothetical protein IPP37_12780 [Saprospiraceae bacterium]|nr:hypothetical protein [Saprospiraceae bacterium]
MSVGGDIKTEKGLGIKNVAVKLRSNQAGMEKQRLTDVSGRLYVWRLTGHGRLPHHR